MKTYQIYFYDSATKKLQSAGKCKAVSIQAAQEIAESLCPTDCYFVIN